MARRRSRCNIKATRPSQCGRLTADEWARCVNGAARAPGVIRALERRQGRRRRNLCRAAAALIRLNPICGSQSDKFIGTQRAAICRNPRHALFRNRLPPGLSWLSWRLIEATAACLLAASAPRNSASRLARLARPAGRSGGQWGSGAGGRSEAISQQRATSNPIWPKCVAVNRPARSRRDESALTGGNSRSAGCALEQRARAPEPTSMPDSAPATRHR